MIANFFQSLESNRVAYLLISGQATVLYGAATFSEDVDLWVEPSPENIRHFRSALRQVGARYYKLTPPLEPRYLASGHGFHFVFDSSPAETVFLDVLGRPPRSRPFSEAKRESQRIETEWGNLPVIGIGDLIGLKKTQRLADYPIISALTLRLLETSEVSPGILRWAASNLFTMETFLSFNERYPEWTQSPPADLPMSLTQFAGRPQEEVLDQVIEEATSWMLAAIARHQIADRQYWRPIIKELRQLRRDRGLVPEGRSV